MNKDLIRLIKTVLLFAVIGIILALISGCSTYRVETTATGARVYGRGVYEQTADGDVTIDTSSGNSLDNVKMIGTAALEALSGTAARLGLTVGD